ncbi:MAG: GntR family transcriptional regulator [Clostridium fessum]
MDQTQPIIQYTTVSDSVYLWVKNAIIQGEFKVRQNISPRNASTKTLGVSRTPVRDAIKRLEAEGLLITKPHCGAVVFQLSKERLTEIYDIRILMEQYCAARTCIRASDDDITPVGRD